MKTPPHSLDAGTQSAVLRRDAWIPYQDAFVRSRIVLQYPKNAIFAMQCLQRLSENPAYEKFPNAERFNPSVLKNVDWPNAIVVFDADDRIVVAPEELKRLLNLDRRLRYREAERTIFGPLPRLHQFADRLGRFLGGTVDWMLVAVGTLVFFAVTIWRRSRPNSKVRLLLRSDSHRRRRRMLKEKKKTR